MCFHFCCLKDIMLLFSLRPLIIVCMDVSRNSVNGSNLFFINVSDRASFVFLITCKLKVIIIFRIE
jgi:hypothetical protein